MNLYGIVCCIGLVLLEQGLGRTSNEIAGAGMGNSAVDRHSVEVTAPTNNANVLGNVLLYLEAQASAVNGSIAKVEFQVDDTIVGVDLTVPYRLPWTARRTGTHTITAKATDASGTTQQHTITVEVDELLNSDQALGELTHDHYQVYYGDLDGNGGKDIYFHDIATGTASFIIYFTPAGYSPPFASTLERSQLSTLQKATRNKNYYFRDVDRDGLSDAFIHGASENDPFLVLYGNGRWKQQPNASNLNKK